MAGKSYFAEGGEKVPVDDVKEVSAEKKTKRPRKTRSTKKITEEIDNTKFKGSNVLKPFPNNTNPKTGEVGGPRGPEPTRFGDWERKGRVTDFWPNINFIRIAFWIVLSFIVLSIYHSVKCIHYV